MNAVQLAANARGMGFTIPGFNPSSGGDVFGGGDSGGGGFDWGNVINQGFQFGNQFLQQWGNRGAYQAGINPNGPSYVTPQTQYQPGADPYAAPGSQVAGGISQAWANAAATIGVAPGTLTIIALGAGALLFMSPPGRRRNPARRSNPKRRRSTRGRR
jgi:hypothetical protein